MWRRIWHSVAPVHRRRRRDGITLLLGTPQRSTSPARAGSLAAQVARAHEHARA
jgi:hypothetical protein